MKSLKSKFIFKETREVQRNAIPKNLVDEMKGLAKSIQDNGNHNVTYEKIVALNCIFIHFIISRL
jgi:hypothetical protein